MTDGVARALFEPDASGFVSAPIARGPWDERMMHGGAPSALLARTVEAAEPGGDLVVTRLTIDFLSGVPLGGVEVTATVVRPGRRFQVVEATLDAGGRRACLVRAVRVRRADLPAAAASPSGPAAQIAGRASLSPPEGGEPLPMFVDHEHELFYPDACEIRHVAGTLGSGAAAAWIRLRGELLPGEPPSQLSRVAAAADFANGLSWILPWSEWLFVNTELTIHLSREARGEWIGVDARTSVSAAGFGLSTATLHDLDGPVGTCAQALFVEPR
jgi:hypothetical protein